MAKTSRQSNELTSLGDKRIVFSVQQFVTYSITFLTIGASIYTFFKALPKIDSLDQSLQQLKESNARVDQKISDLQEFITANKELQKKQTIENGK